MNLLVAGAARVDAGKTTFSTGLIERTNGVGFKPRAGNDYWYDHQDVLTALRSGRLFGHDADRLTDAGVRDVQVEGINPVHRLWQPSPGPGQGLLGREDREFLVDRVGDTFVVNDTVDLPGLVREHLPLSDARAVDSLAAANDAMADLHLPALQGLADAVGDADRAVVESYADVALPLSDVAFDAVAVVEPRRARIYHGDRFLTACDVAGGSARAGQLETTVADVTDLVDPVASTELPVLGDTERRDPADVADAYEVAYDALLAAAVE